MSEVTNFQSYLTKWDAHRVNVTQCCLFIALVQANAKDIYC